MNIRELGYIVLETADLTKWRSYAEDVLGMMVGRSADAAMTLRMDERDCRILLKKSDAERLISIGWLVDSRKDLKQVAEELAANGFVVIEGTEAECAERRVNKLIATIDPAGARHEFAWGPVANFLERFQSKVGVRRFVTGDQGLGHAVLAVPPEQFEAEEFFIEEVLGFTLANFRRTSVNPARAPATINWYGSGNGRHHTLAIGKAEGKHALQHIMLEVDSIDDVGRALDRAMDRGERMASVLGRHSNDSAISFYTVSPSEFWVEYGFVMPGTTYGEVSWDDGSVGVLWGHRFNYNA